MSPSIILLTGLPGCGKTTLIKRVVQRLDHLRLALVRKLLENGSPILASVAMKGGGADPGGEKAAGFRNDHVSPDNRDGLVEALVEQFTQAVSLRAKKRPN